jgi:hypothetical protein
MSRETLKFQISPYGRVSSALQELVDQGTLQREWVRTFMPRSLGRSSADLFHLWVAFSLEVDDAFVKAFREHSTPATRLLIMNERQSADTLFTHLLNLQIRSPQRFYLADCSVSGEMYYMAALLQRIASALKSNENDDLILDARLEAGVLHVISPNFNRLDVPITKIPEFKNADASKLQAFEIDEDGSFIYWPEFDLHLGWAQLQQLVNPQAALKASQKSQEFNKRYGRAVQKVREQAGLEPSGISGISGKQLQRIENGECRLTSNAIEVLSQAHKLAPNEYMKRLAEALD